MLSIIKGPYLQWPTETSMTFMWETSEETTARVDILAATRVHGWKRYEQPEHMLITVTEEAPARLHRVTVHGLEPGTVYFYKVTSACVATGCDPIESGPHPFKTAMGPGVPFSFTVTSETGGYSGFDTTGGQINTALFEQMQCYRPDLALFVGDIVNDGQQYEDWEKHFFGPGRSFLMTTPAYCCPGNHENYADSYKDWFAFPPPSIYYSFDYGDVHFISLDATDFVKKAHYPQGAGEMSPGHAQYDFLVRDLEDAAAAKWKIVFFHYPPYVSGSYQVEAMRALCPVLERHGVSCSTRTRSSTSAAIRCAPTGSTTRTASSTLWPEEPARCRTGCCRSGSGIRPNRSRCRTSCKSWRCRTGWTFVRSTWTGACSTRSRFAKTRTGGSRIFSRIQEASQARSSPPEAASQPRPRNAMRALPARAGSPALPRRESPGPARRRTGPRLRRP